MKAYVINVYKLDENFECGCPSALGQPAFIDGYYLRKEKAEEYLELVKDNVPKHLLPIVEEIDIEE